MTSSKAHRPDSDIKDEYQQMAEKIRSGEYFEESRHMYDVAIHDAMAERYLYIFITIISAVIFVISYAAKQSLYPLNKPVPYVYYPNDLLEDLPHMDKLQRFKGEDPNEGVLRYVVGNYVKVREAYKVDKFDQNVMSIKNQSTPEVVSQFQESIDPLNPESPIVLYQRHTKRTIEIMKWVPLQKGSEYNMEVLFKATLTGKGEIKESYWKANIAFQFNGVKLGEDGKALPLSFTVTKYQSKRLQDSQ